MNPSAIPTPRTDAQVRFENPDGVPGNTAIISTSFARQLEQELQQAREELESLRIGDGGRNHKLVHILFLKQMQEERDNLQSQLSQAKEELAQEVSITRTLKDHGLKLESQLSQAQGELAQLKSSQEKVLSTAASFEHWGKERIELQQQLSQWQECAREMAETLTHAKRTLAELSTLSNVNRETSRLLMTVSEICSDKVSLFTQLTSTTTGETKG